MLICALDVGCLTSLRLRCKILTALSAESVSESKRFDPAMVVGSKTITKQ